MDISKIDPKTLMSIYSIVFQDVTLFNNSIMENIRIGKQNATDEEVIAAAKLAHCDEFAELLFTRHYPARRFGMKMSKFLRILNHYRFLSDNIKLIIPLL